MQVDGSANGRVGGRGRDLPFAAVIFDLDGTLLDSHDLVAKTVNRVLEGRGYPLAEARRVHAMTGLPIEEIFASVLPAAEVERVQACVDEYRAFFDRDVIPAVQPIPGALEAVAAIAAAYGPLAVATGRRTDGARAMLTKVGLIQHMAVVVGMDIVPRPKPYPDVLIEAMARLGNGALLPEETLYVGDSTADMAVALAAGTRACAVTWGAQARDELLGANPHFCVDNWDELRTLVGA